MTDTSTTVMSPTTLRPRPVASDLPPPFDDPSNVARAATTSTRRKSAARPRYDAGQPLNHCDSFILRGEDLHHHPDSRPPSPDRTRRLPSHPEGEADADRRDEDDEEARTLASANGNGRDPEKGLPLKEARKSDNGPAGRKVERARSSRGDAELPPEEREWANDIVTFDSKDDVRPAML